MELTYDPATCTALAQSFEAARICRPMRIERYEPGATLTYDVMGVSPAKGARVAARIERFVGGGFAGQVYRVTLADIQAPDGPLDGLAVGRSYAMKILLPPSSSSLRFRNALYAAGFQGAFQLQVNPAAARTAALWQKLIRRAAAIRFGTERSVADVLATFVDPTLGSCGELGEWIDGRIWRLEVDDHSTALRSWRRQQPVGDKPLGSPEYRAKRQFMAALVKLLHEIGAPELARQYEWWTCKSQPNCLKRLDSEGDPAAGLTAVDFRAGLALLPLLPMSPGDLALIPQGLARGSLVQFDRGDLRQLDDFVRRHAEQFTDLQDALEELHGLEPQYRDAVPDLTHHRLRLLTSRQLRRTIAESTINGWEVRRVVDERCAASLRQSRLRALCFLSLGFAPLLSVAAGAGAAAAGWSARGFSWGWVGLAAALAAGGTAGGRLLRKMWGRADLRRHYRLLFSNRDYLQRSLRAKAAEQLIRWLRAGRVSDERALWLSARLDRFLLHAPLSLLPAFAHRLLTDRDFALQKLTAIFVRPVRLYFDPQAREQWLREMLETGQKNHMLADEDAETIRGQLKDPFIQEYLKSLAVHICTLPVTELVGLLIAMYIIITRGESWDEALATVAMVLIIFQVTPISPGSIARGLYVVYRVIRERNLHDYNIAVCLGFFKYVGYLAFPIQMAYRYPTLARFMAAHWATGVVGAVPVFGERGALLEHAVFGLFYNYPLTIRRRMSARAAYRRMMPPRVWHAPVAAAAAAGILACVQLAAVGGGAPTTGPETVLANLKSSLQSLSLIWPAALTIPLLTGAAVTTGAGGLALPRRIILAALSGILLGALYSLLHMFSAGAVGTDGDLGLRLSRVVAAAVWPAFGFAIGATLGAVATEVFLPELDRANRQPGSSDSMRPARVVASEASGSLPSR